MFRSWSVLAPVAVLAAMVFLLLPGGGARPSPAFAEDCTLGNTGTLVIRIVDASTGNPLATDGAQVLVKPDPRDFILDEIVTDGAISDVSSVRDRDSRTGVIRLENACSTEGNQSYTATLFALPSTLEDCDTKEDSDSTQLDADDTETLTLVVDCTGVGPTPVATATATPGPAATVIANTSPLSVGCSGTSIVSITVRDAAGKPVGAGTAVAITTTLGSITAPNQVTNASGIVSTFFAAPSSTGGTATITAKAGAGTGTATVNVNCGGVTGTTAPPPTVSAGGGGQVITPPSTGDGGLTGTQTAWLTMAVVLTMVSTTATMVVVRIRLR